MKKDNGDSCFSLVAVFVMGFVVCWFFNSLIDPNAGRKLIEFIEGTVLCLGVVIVFFMLFYLYTLLSTEWNKMLHVESRHYPIRCSVTKMQPIPPGSLPDNLPEETGPEAKAQFYLNLRLTNFGLCFTAFPSTLKNPSVLSNPASLYSLFHRTSSMAMIIPISEMNLYYSVYRYIKNSTLRTKPPDSIGYTDEVPKIPEGDQIELVILFNRYRENNNRQNLLCLVQPLKLEIVALDRHGRDNSTDTSWLYKTIYERIKFSKAADDDSWIYRSRPIYW